MGWWAKLKKTSQLCRAHNWNIIYLQETHRDENSNMPNIESMHLVAEALHKRYGSARSTKNSMTIISTRKKTTDDTVIFTIESKAFTVVWETGNSVHSRRFQQLHYIKGVIMQPMQTVSCWKYGQTSIDSP